MRRSGWFRASSVAIAVLAVLGVVTALLDGETTAAWWAGAVVAMALTNLITAGS